MPAYNHAEFVEEAMQSVMEQDYPDIELIVVDDGSKDGTLDVIKRYHANTAGRLKFTTKVNGGVSSALNAAYRLCSGNLIAVLASDDFYMPGKIRKQVEAFSALDPSYGIVHTSAYNLYLDGSRVDITGLYPPAEGECFKELVALTSVAVAPSVMFTRDAYLSAGGFDESLTAEDLDFYASVARKGYKFHYIPEPLVVKRQTGRNLGANIDTNYQSHIGTLKKFQNHLTLDEYKYSMRSILLSKGRHLAGENRVLDALSAYSEAADYGGGKVTLLTEWASRSLRSIVLRSIPSQVRSELRTMRSTRRQRKSR